jgi:uncharacterized protein
MLSPETAQEWYPDDPVHGFAHVLRVYRMAERLALEEGADLEIVRAAVLLHDAQDPAQDGDGSNHAARRLVHHHNSAEFAGQVLAGEGWLPERITAVQHAIRAHRFRDNSEPPASLEARVLFDADKLDAIGAIGVARAIAYAARAGEPAYAPVSAQFHQTGVAEAGERHSAYHEYLFKLVKLKDMLYTPAARRLAEERHNRMLTYFEQLVSEMEAES